MGVALTPEGKSLIARLQAEGKALIIDRFLFAHVAGQDETAPPATAMPENVVHTAAIPPEYRAYVTPSQVVYSALLGSDVGDFAFNWQGLYCTDHGVIVAVATFPALQKRAYDAQTNTPGNNLTRNFILEFSGAQELTGITVEAEVWQLDFTVRLKGIDERERLSNFDIYGESAFIGDAWLVTDASAEGTGGVYTFAAGIGYVGGIRAMLYEAMTVPVENYPCDVWLDVSLPRQGSDVITEALPLFLAENALEGAYHVYRDVPPYKLAHYCAKIAHIDQDGNVTDLRKKYTILPEEGEDGDVLMRKGGAWVVGKVDKYDIGQNYWFEDELERPGLFPCMGGLITNVSQRFPEIVKYLQAAHGQFRCVTQAGYDALHVATWHTCADGTKIGWEGIGGVNKFVLDLVADTLRLPDLRGMSPEMIGDSLGVGGVHGDMARRILGGVAGVMNQDYAPYFFGALYFSLHTAGILAAGGAYNYGSVMVDNARTGPTGNKNQPRAWGALACVYLGQPAS